MKFPWATYPDVVKLFAKKIVELNNQYYRENLFFQSNEALVLKAGQKYSKSKKFSDMQLILG